MLSVYCVVFEMSTGWREFDDSKVREINESCITTKAAYVLFYRRRAAPVSAVPPPISPASVPAAVSASPISSEASAVQQTTTAEPISSSQAEATASRKTVTPVPLAAPAEFNETAWQTDMEAID